MRSCIHRSHDGKWSSCEYEEWSTDDGMSGPTCRLCEKRCSEIATCPKTKLACSTCSGPLKEANRDFKVVVDHEVMIVQGLPAFVCEWCYEIYWPADSSRRIDAAMKEFWKRKKE
jgi:YgiT-type zinc finger domain-containing protein